MPSITRRRALHGAAALLAGLAGCPAEKPGPGAVPEDRPSGTVVTDPESYSLRNPEREPLVWTGERPTPEADDEERYRYDHRFFVADAETAAAVSFADVGGADGARAFLDATDFDAETLYVEQTPVEECFRNELCHVRWSADEVHTSYARYYRPADVACERGAADVTATLIRIPAVVDPDEVSGYGSSRGSGTCEERNRRVRERRGEGGSR